MAQHGQEDIMVNFAFSTLHIPGQPADAVGGVGGINDFGQIAGSYVSGSGERHLFVRTAGHYDIGPANQASNGIVSGLNNLDLIVGSYPSFDDRIFTQRFDPFTKHFGEVQNFVDPFPNYPVSGGVDDFGDVVGTSVLVGPEGPAAATAWIEKAGAFKSVELPHSYAGNPSFTEATGINDLGQITGWYGDGHENHGFLDTNGSFKTITMPGALTTEPTAINNLGMVAGTYSYGGYTPTHGFVDIGGKFTTVDFPGATDTVITGINDFGQIVGAYDEFSNGFSAGSFIATPVPTPDDQINLAVLKLTELGLAMRPGFLKSPLG